ncbi:MAG: M28 family peptidase [Thermoleophilaceae bacterium]|nr:M28 family peptidase [Thermoleophilaceae bacterium]
MGLLDLADLGERISRLAAIDRASASPGEAEAARIIAGELREAGARVSVEEESAHGTYWWPVGLLTGLAAAAGLRSPRPVAVLCGLFAAGAVADDITGGQQWFRRRFLPSRNTTNVVAEFGRKNAARTVLVTAHHDAAHSGLVFHPELPRAIFRRFPNLAEHSDTTPGTMWGAVGGPLLVAAGAALGLRAVRRAGAFVSAGYVAAMADIGLRSVVPGANDNLTGVAVLLSLARSLREEPLSDVRVILLSTGSEESFMEGMQAYGRRHFASLDPQSTQVICIDTVGSPRLLALEGEGMVWMNEYPKDLLARVKAEADALGIELVPNLRLRNATDGLIAHRAGYETVVIGSVDELKLPSNYHWPSDTADNVDLSTVYDCTRLVDRLVRASPPS